MHSRITLVVDHHQDHDVPVPTVEFYRTPEREVQLWFREADDETSAMVGCPECVLALLRQTAAAIEAKLDKGEWLDFDPKQVDGVGHQLGAAQTLKALDE